MPSMKYEIQSYDCQVLNPNYAAAGTAVTDGANGKNMTLLLVASGFVKVGPSKESETRGFSETFVLVPNAETSVTKAQRKPAKEWLIQSQNFRFVV